MIKKLFFILIFSIFIWSQAFASNCSHININPSIKLFSSFGKLSIDENKNNLQLTEFAKIYNIVEQGFFASGLSTVKTTFDISINVLSQPTYNQNYCVYPSNINLFFGFDSPTIFISNEIPKDSCKYQQVLLHEQIHHQINKSTLEFYLPLLKQAATKIIKSIPAVEITNLSETKEAIEHITNTYNQKLSPLIDFIKKEMITEQQKLDNPANYQYEADICAKTID